MSGELRVQRLSKAFPVGRGWSERKWQTVFEDIEFTVKNGEFVSLIGPSGCGKSTLLNIAAGLDNASSGAVYASEKRVSGPGLDRGVVFQEFALFPWLSVRDNVSFGLRSKGLSRANAYARADKFIELVGLTQFANYYPNRLSGGMRQRVGIGRALAVEPAVLLMDEPFGALDALTRENMQIALGSIWQNTRTTVLFITHDIDEAVYLSDRVLVLNGRPSRVVLELSIDLPRPRNRHDARFQSLTRELEDAIRQRLPDPVPKVPTDPSEVNSRATT